MRWGLPLWLAGCQIGAASLPAQGSPLAAGDAFACVIHADGTVWCWGDNRDGELGGGTEVAFSATPVQVPGLTGATHLAAARHWAAALRADGTVWTWGRGGWGMRNGTPEVYLEGGPPTQVAGLDQVRQLALGELHGCALREGGSVWCWGYDRAGRLGDPSRFPLASGQGTAPAPGIAPPGAASLHSAAPADPRPDPGYAPAPVPGISGATAIAAFGTRSAAVIGGEVWVWGNAAARVEQQWSPLGVSPITHDEIAPQKVAGLSDVVQVSLHQSHLVAVHQDGTVSAAGLVVHWAPKPSAPRSSPITLTDPIAYPAELGSVAEAVAFEGVAVRLSDGSVRAWGARHGRGDGQDSGPPSRLPLRAAAITAGREFVCVLDEDGTVWGWGAGWAGQLGAPDGQPIGDSEIWYADQPVKITRTR